MIATPRVQFGEGVRPSLSTALRDQLARQLRRAARPMGIEAIAMSSLGLRIVGDREMARLHLTYMGESGPTDVLSFSPQPDDPSADLGDIAIDWQAAARQARGPSSLALLHEITLLAVHGLAHLLGHDHRDPREGRRMHALERRTLRVLAVPDRGRAYLCPVPLSTHRKSALGAAEGSSL